ncbi:mRNA capping enzyme-domain-containing protein [Lipomyces oligophaga]|uniref:mRNA capping enzyme-domain-containing protein n=1 Tax=Lipomyces oligophaga TaxID=45792 RepID=UPI0034CE7B71
MVVGIEEISDSDAAAAALMTLAGTAAQVAEVTNEQQIKVETGSGSSRIVDEHKNVDSLDRAIEQNETELQAATAVAQHHDKSNDNQVERKPERDSKSTTPPPSPPRSSIRKLKRPGARSTDYRRRNTSPHSQDIELQRKRHRIEQIESQRPNKTSTGSISPGTSNNDNRNSNNNSHISQPRSNGRSEEHVDTVVRRHYNSRQEVGVHRRQSSPIIKLKAYNNFIKAILIKRFSNPGDIVLDLGCGKGGDLGKWENARIKGYIGVDIADISIEQAQDRYNTMRRKYFWAEFFASDAFGIPIASRLPRDMYQAVFPVDVISMQFCLHYAFETEAKARQMLENVSRSLKRGGKFFGTIPSSDVIKEGIAKLPPGQKEWGNSVYNIRFVSDPPRNGVFRPPFGHKYTFYLQDAVENVPEYVVPFEVFRAMAEDYKLELLYRKGFHELFQDETSEHPEYFNLCRRMGVTKNDNSYGIEGDQREAAGFYLAFAFEKLAG